MVFLQNTRKAKTKREEGINGIGKCVYSLYIAYFLVLACAGLAVHAGDVGDAHISHAFAMCTDIISLPLSNIQREFCN